MMSGELTELLRTLADQVRARDPDAQLATIERIGLDRLFALETLVGALTVGGVELLTFIAELGSEHSADPACYQNILRICQAAREAAIAAGHGDQQLKVRVATELLNLFRGQMRVTAAAPASDRLLILDDIFPALASGFRLAEYNTYLERYPHALIRSTGAAFHFLGETRPFSAVVATYEAAYPEFAGRVGHLNPRTLPGARLVYVVFIMNAFKFLPLIEAMGAGLVFTLYPGGGFKLNDPVGDTKLRRVFSSPSFRAVIVTQTVTRDYLLEKKLCPPEKIHFIFGCVNLPPAEGAATRRHFGLDKPTLDICFVAHKYMPGGIDKGFDVFLAVARRLAAEFPAARFHVVGTLTAADGDTTGLDGRLTFHGILKTDALQQFFTGMDLILSPNAPFKLRPGAFDGFPTGSCIEAALAGVPVFCTDELKLNVAFKDREEIVILTRDPDEIVATVGDYCRNPARLRELSARCAAAFHRVLALSDQMAARCAILDQFLAASPTPAEPQPEMCQR